MRARVFTLIAALVIGTRLCHSSVLWADDNLPLAAAMEVARGKTLYRDVWFDKPPLVAWIDLLWGARPGVLLRLAGAAYVIACAFAAFQCARIKWGEQEGLLAAFFSALFLTFDLPSAVIPLASDMLLILPHLAAIYFAWRGRAFWSGIASGVGLLCSSKAVFVLAACALWQWRQAPWLLAGFAIPNAVVLGWMGLNGSAAEYYQQVWKWGSMYAADTFVEHPLAEGLKRSANWFGFHAALAVGAVIALARDRDRRVWAWMALSAIGVVLGLRFFPRYYFLLLPAMVLAGARGWALATESPLGKRKHAPPGSQAVFPTSGTRFSLSALAWLTIAVLAVLLAIPVVRFAPHYFTLALGHTWSDLSMDRDSRDVSARLRSMAANGDTLFVWGYRPDIFIDSGLPAGTGFLESQSISGVLADRHLFSSVPSAPPHPEELIHSHPTWVVDGIGLLNPVMALARQDALATWFEKYREVERTRFSIVYQLR